MTWVSNLSYGGYSDWRLPTTLQPDVTCGNQSNGLSSGVNCTGSEMGHLFYNELGGVAGLTIYTTHNTNYNLFQNIQSIYPYWSGTQGYQQPWETEPSIAWFFGFGAGTQGLAGKGWNYFAWAVRDGDVSAVPVPAAAWLFGSG